MKEREREGRGEREQESKRTNGRVKGAYTHTNIYIYHTLSYYITSGD